MTHSPKSSKPGSRSTRVRRTSSGASTDGSADRQSTTATPCHGERPKVSFDDIKRAFERDLDGE